MNTYKSFDDMNKLTATESRVSANAMVEDGGTGREDGDWDSAMDNLVAIMISNKGQVEQLIETNASLVEQHKVKDATIARIVSENANLVLIMTKNLGGKPSAVDLLGANGGGGEKKTDDTPFDPKGYCWSHGYHVH